MSEKDEGAKVTMPDGRIATWKSTYVRDFDKSGSTGGWVLRLSCDDCENWLDSEKVSCTCIPSSAGDEAERQ